MDYELIGKCIACGKRFEIGPRLAAIADEAGCVISPCCNFPSTIVRVKARGPSKTVSEAQK
jgi:hypothetical protein